MTKGEALEKLETFVEMTSTEELLIELAKYHSVDELQDFINHIERYYEVKL